MLRGDRTLRSTDRALRSNAFEQSLQALVLVDRESTVVGLNQAAERLTGWSRTEAMGRPAADVLEVRTETGVNLCAANGPLRRALRQGKAVDTHFAYLFRFRTSDEPVRVSYSVAPIRDGDGVAAVLIAIHDVTPELEIIQAKDALMLAASHELKTPVTTLKGLSELLLDFDLTEPQRRELLQDLHGQVNRMERLIADLLDVSRIDAGRMSIELSSVEVGPVIDHVCEEVGPLLQQRPLRRQVPAALPPVFGQSQKLHQILVNLLTNAIKYSPDGSPVELSVTADREQVHFGVRDEGVGIRSEDLPRVFHKFYRAEDPVVRRIPGTGLGLYIVRSLVEMLGGHVDVRSQYGKGSVFTISLPRAQADRARRRAAVAAS
ncbi:MAG TPA: PAS domain-containing sensor histidine kinase [Candidatus Eisenbacteria bacterium]|nr:PAS domain-containing sensor histidine kinase [Candidatus Eisenbacteria bacterium]